MNARQNIPVCFLLLLVALSGCFEAFAQAPGKMGKRAPAPEGAASYELVSSAWKAHAEKDYPRAVQLADRCVADYSAAAIAQQATLKRLPPPEEANDYWALNDVATALFIKGRSLEAAKRTAGARLAYAEIVRRYSFGQCWDSKDFFWSVGAAARDRIKCIDYNIDFGDYSSSTLTGQAWTMLNQGRLIAAQAYADKCIELYSEEAKKMQMSLRGFPSEGLEWDYWALNDVGTCLFIKGQVLLRQRKEKEAATVFREILGSYSYAQCWDNSGGWFWKIGDAARKLLYKNKEL